MQAAPAPTPATPAASAEDTEVQERQRRYREAQAHPLIKDLLKRFEADIVSRELGERQDWLRRLGPGQ